MRASNKIPGLAIVLFALGGCVGDAGEATDDITDVAHTDVERQAIGNCWLYAEASWVESMHLSATDESFDVSQSYWTYWHWYDQIKSGWRNEISTGGNESVAHGIVRNRGLMNEADFLSEDVTGEMSWQQSTALATINQELESGRLQSAEARADGKLVRQVLDEAWALSGEMRAELDEVFGEDGSTTLRSGARVDGTAIIDPQSFAVQYTRRSGSSTTVKDTNLVVAIQEWRTAAYPSWGSGSSLATQRRTFLQRVQRALHDRQPVVITWNVDFNALENREGDLQGSFNLTTLADMGGPGRQGGHMTVLEDYQAVTEEYGLLEAGVTLDPSKPEDAAKLDAALLPSTTISFLRVKNSWGSLRPDREFAKGFPGYHDLHLDYLNGPVKWCPDVENKTNENCTGQAVPLRNVMLPPGY